MTAVCMYLLPHKFPPEPSAPKFGAIFCIEVRDFIDSKNMIAEGLENLYLPSYSCSISDHTRV